MFAKPASGKPATSEPQKKPLAASLIGEDVRIAGDLASDGEVHLDGRVTGDLHAARLVVGETGVVEGAISADTVEVRGRVRGPISARAVKLHACAEVEGDIAHEELSIDAGARFNGRSIRTATQLALQVAAE